MKSYSEYVADVRAQVSEIGVVDLQRWMSDGAVLIDVREPGEWSNGAIPGAVHIPRGVLEGAIDAHPCMGNAEAPDRRQMPIVLYCHSGARSALAAKDLEAMGFHHVVSLAEGYQGWSQKSCK